MCTGFGPAVRKESKTHHDRSMSRPMLAWDHYMYSFIIAFWRTYVGPCVEVRPLVKWGQTTKILYHSASSILEMSHFKRGWPKQRFYERVTSNIKQHQATLGHLWCSSSEQDLYYPWTWPIQPIRPNSSTYCFPFEEGKSHDLIMTKWWIVFPSWIPRSAVQELWLCGADLRGCSLCSSTAAVGSWLHCGRASDGPDFGQTLETGGLECQGAEQRGCRAAELQGSNLGVWLCQSSLQVDLGCFKTRSSI